MGYRIWWEKEGLDLAGTRAAVAAEADVGGGSEGGGWSVRRQQPGTEDMGYTVSH